jgi:hypothetical protein
MIRYITKKSSSLFYFVTELIVETKIWPGLGHTEVCNFQLNHKCWKVERSQVLYLASTMVPHSGFFLLFLSNLWQFSLNKTVFVNFSLLLWWYMQKMCCLINSEIQRK